MPQVLNRSKNASALINGIKFSPTKNGAISEEITQDQADYFLSIPNYVAVKVATPKAPAAPVADPAADAAAAAAAEREAAERENAAAQASAEQKQS